MFFSFRIIYFCSPPLHEGVIELHYLSILYKAHLWFILSRYSNVNFSFFFYSKEVEV